MIRCDSTPCRLNLFKKKERSYSYCFYLFHRWFDMKQRINNSQDKPNSHDPSFRHYHASDGMTAMNCYQFWVLDLIKKKFNGVSLGLFKKKSKSFYLKRARFWMTTFFMSTSFNENQKVSRKWLNATDFFFFFCFFTRDNFLSFTKIKTS